MGMSPSRRQRIEAVVASTIGTTIEWYDFFLYGTMATLVFPRLFFPTDDAFASQISSLGTFLLGFLARPLGGILFGAMGDRLGRKAALVATLLLMGVSTVVIGILPTHRDIGVWAPILLSILRLIQGLGVGGEWGGAVLMALEFGDAKGRGFRASWPQAGVPLGLLASTGVVAACQGMLSVEAFLDWGWRVPFLLSGLLVVVGMLIRTRIEESPLFAELLANNDRADAPVRETLRLHWGRVLLVAGARITENASFYIFTVAVLSYGNQSLGIGADVMLMAVNLGAVAQFGGIPLFGHLSDRFSRRGGYLAGCLFLIAFAFPYYALLETRETFWIVAATIIGLGVGHASLYGIQASWIPELFGTRVRCTGASIAYQLAGPLAGGVAPIIALALAHYFPNQYWPLALYIIVNSLVSLACVLCLPETSRKEL